ncbi:MAG: type I-B CRISPR-associated protein Cas7/Cst2/DevR [Candidatus Pacearchaeota archaeon]
MKEVNKMSKFIVLDIVFHGNSLNYDQGTGNIQELKKITRWDGKQYTLVSRYALRYSILEMLGKNNPEIYTPAEKLEKIGNKNKENQENGVIQPKIEFLLSGEILKYPEFNLFGYLITSINPQASRDAKVKISHAISLTPFNYDTHFNANIGLAKRISKSTGEMGPNLFTIEEHITYYIYTVVIDEDEIGKMEVCINKETEKLDKNEIKIDSSVKCKCIDNNNRPVEVTKIIIEEKQTKKKEKVCEIKLYDTNNNSIEIDKKNIILEYELKDKQTTSNLIKELLDAIFNLKRNIKGRSEDLSPKLAIIGFYDGKYQSFKDRISLLDEYNEEIIEEETKLENGKKIVKKIVKTTKPKFKIESSNEFEKLNTLEDILNNFKEIKDSKKIYLYTSPEIKVEANIAENKSKVTNSTKE